MDAVIEGSVGLDDLVKGAVLSDVLYDAVGHFAVDTVDHVGSVGNGGEDALALGLGASGYDDVEAAFEEVVEDVRGDEAGATCCQEC